MWNYFKPFGADTALFEVSDINTMADDVLALQVTRASAAMLLTFTDKLVIAFYHEQFQLPEPF